MMNVCGGGKKVKACELNSRNKNDDLSPFAIDQQLKNRRRMISGKKMFGQKSADFRKLGKRS
jgi:hypothetical protein